MPYFDQWGWYSEAEIPGRFTDVPVPTNIPEGYAANFTGHVWEVRLYSAPPAPPPADKMTKLAFRNRFTQAEKVAIEIASLDDPAASMQQRAMAAALRSSQQDIAVAQYIEPGSAATIAGVQELETAGLLAPGRAAEILDTPIADNERFVG
jgi:hypothetical protein